MTWPNTDYTNNPYDPNWNFQGFGMQTGVPSLYNTGIGSTSGFNPQNGLKSIASSQGNYNPTEGYSGMLRDSRFTESPGLPIKAGVEKLGSFLGSGNILGGLLGGTLGGITAWQQAKAQNRAISKAIGGLQDSKSRFVSMRSDNINRSMGVSTDIMNKYALSKDPNDKAGYSQGYSGVLGSMHATDNALGSQIAQTDQQIGALKGQKLSRGQIAMNTIGGIFSGGQQMGNIFTQSRSNQFSADIYNKLNDRLNANPQLLDDIFKFNAPKLFT